MSEAAENPGIPETVNPKYELRGRLQIGIIRDALEWTRELPDTASMLSTLLRMHNNSPVHNGDKNILSIKLDNKKGDIKEKILNNLEVVGNDDTAPENLRMECQTLFNVLTEHQEPEHVK